MWFENQFPYFLWMVLCGAGIMLFYDFLRISRRMIRCPDFLVNLEDLLFACLSAVVVFYVTYLKNNGELRLHTAVGLFAGCLIYILLVRDRFVRLGCRISKWMGKVLKGIFKMASLPFMIIFKIVRKPARFVFWYTGKSIKAVKNKAALKVKNIRYIVRRK